MTQQTESRPTNTMPREHDGLIGYVEHSLIATQYAPWHKAGLSQVLAEASADCPRYMLHIETVIAASGEISRSAAIVDTEAFPLPAIFTVPYSALNNYSSQFWSILEALGRLNSKTGDAPESSDGLWAIRTYRVQDSGDLTYGDYRAWLEATAAAGGVDIWSVKCLDWTLAPEHLRK